MKKRQTAALALLITVMVSGCSLVSEGSGTGSPGAAPITQTITTPAAASTQPVGTTATVTQAASTVATKPVSTTPPVTVPVKSEAELLVESWSGKIYPGITISGIRVGGLTPEEARIKSEGIIEKALLRKISFTVYGKSYSVTQKDLGVTFDAKAALEQARTFYDAKTIEEKAALIKSETPVSLKIGITQDAKKISAFVDSVAAKADRKATTQLEGITLLQDALEKELAARVSFTTKAAASFTAPVKTQEKIKLPISTKGTITKGSSYYDADDEARTYNLKLAAKRINGKVIQPGEVFSVLQHIKAPNRSNGYKLAPVHLNGTLAEGSGGGVCQVSSTLYNAVVRAGLELVEHHHHVYSVFYLPYGMDATLYAPSKDFKFRNTLNYPITIKATAASSKLTISFVSEKKALNGYSYKFSQKVTSEGPKTWKTEYTKDLKKGKTQVVFAPHPKLTVKVYRSTYKNGEKIKTELFDQASYRNMAGLRLKGQ